jgi:hypothetical protein
MFQPLEHSSDFSLFFLDHAPGNDRRKWPIIAMNIWGSQSATPRQSVVRRAAPASNELVPSASALTH